MAIIDDILDGLMRRYKERVPDVSRVINAMIREGVIGSVDDIENDHIAFRTMGVPQLGLKSLEKSFCIMVTPRWIPMILRKKNYRRFGIAHPETICPVFLSVN